LEKNRLNKVSTYYILILVYNEKYELFQMTFNVIKCKEHYIDCYSVVAYDICDACSKLQILMHLSVSSMGKSNKEIPSCPLHVRI